jgi:hypothetical protein
MGVQVHIGTQLMAEVAGRDQRRASRAPIQASATLRPLGTYGRDAVVRDISTTGFMAESDQSFTPGETARLQLPDIGFVSARVVWTHAGRIGGEFDQPIAPGAFARLVAHCSA